MATGDDDLGVEERVFSAVIVNPLDVAKTRVQTQVAGVQYSHPLSNITSRMSYFGPSMAGVHGTVLICPPDCFHYKGTLYVFHKIIRQCAGRIWEAAEGTNASLALPIPAVGIYLPLYDVFRIWLENLTAQNVPGATPYVPLLAGSLARSLACATCYPVELAKTHSFVGKSKNESGLLCVLLLKYVWNGAFKASQIDKKLPGVWRTLLELLSHVRSSSDVHNNIRGYRVLWTGMGAQLARDVPFSAICWSTLEPVRTCSFLLFHEEIVLFWEPTFVLVFLPEVLQLVQCPLDVVKTRRQIENDPVRAMRMTTWKTLVEVWREGGVQTLFTGVGPRVGHAGPSVGIVVSFYEVVKHILHQRYSGS